MYKLTKLSTMCSCYFPKSFNFNIQQKQTLLGTQYSDTERSHRPYCPTAEVVALALYLGGSPMTGALGGGYNMLGVLNQTPSLNSRGSTTYPSSKYKEDTIRQVQSYRNLGKFRNGQKSNSRSGGISHYQPVPSSGSHSNWRGLRTKTCFQKSKTTQLYH